MDRLKGKVAIITGAAGGICHKASELFCQEGAKVVMVDIDPQVEQFSAEINANGGESIAVVADVAQRDTWVQLKKLADAKYGRIDTVVNGAAAFSPPTRDWAHITSEMIEDVMRVNIDSMLYSYQTVLRYMMKKKIRGSFLNFSSSTALAYNGSAVQGYPFSKACIKLATQNMVNQSARSTASASTASPRTTSGCPSRRRSGICTASTLRPRRRCPMSACRRTRPGRSCTCARTRPSTSTASACRSTAAGPCRSDPRSKM